MAKSETTPIFFDAAFWKINGESIKTVLLRLLTTRPGEFGEQSTMRATAALAGQLLEVGVAAAGELRRAVEAANRGSVP